MKNSHIGKSIFKNNIGFSIGLLFIYVVMIIIAVFSLFLPDSLKGSLSSFIENYNLADAWITVTPSRNYPIDALKSIGNVADVDPVFTIDIDISFAGNDACSARVFTVSDTSKQRFFVYEGGDAGGIGTLGISQRFASTYSLSVGDTLILKTPFGQKDMEIASIVTTPESMVCLRDDLSRNDAYDFCYLYIPYEEADAMFGIGGFVSRFSFFFEDGTDVSEMEAALREAEDILGTAVVSSTLYKTSQFKADINEEMNALSDTIRFMSLVVYSIGLCFSALFVFQIVNKERKTIGLLRALGYSKRDVFRIFLRYVGALSLFAVLIGGFIGGFLVRMSFNVYLTEFSIPEVSIVIDPLRTVLCIGAYFMSVCIACTISSGKITGVDPCEAYGGEIPGDVAIPAWLSRLKLPTLLKITVTSMWRQLGRLLATSICIAACIMLLMMSISTKASEMRAIPVTFDERYRFDISARIDGSKATNEFITGCDGVASYGTYVAFREVVGCRGEQKASTIQTVPERGDLLILPGADGERLYPTDGGILLDRWFADEIGVGVGDRVTVGSVELEVTGIVDEYIDSTQYITEATASALGHSTPNTALIRLEKGADRATVLNGIRQLPGVYFASLTENNRNSCVDNFSALGMVLDIFAYAAIILGLAIVYNMVMLRADEKKTEYATLLELGINNKELFLMAFVENGIEYIPAVIFALIAGRYTSLHLMAVMSTGGHSYLPYRLGTFFAVACALSFIYVFAGAFLTIVKVKKIDPALSLNTGN